MKCPGKAPSPAKLLKGTSDFIKNKITKRVQSSDFNSVKKWEYASQPVFVRFSACPSCVEISIPLL